MIAGDYNPGLADKQFENVKMMSKNNARTKNTKNKEMNKVKFITTFYPILTSIEALIKKNIYYLHSDEVLKKGFRNNKRCKNIRYISYTFYFIYNKSYI